MRWHAWDRDRCLMLKRQAEEQCERMRQRWMVTDREARRFIREINMKAKAYVG